MNPRRTGRLPGIVLKFSCGIALSTVATLPQGVAQHEHHPPGTRGEQRPGEPG